MELYLVQHGEATSEQEDPARPLTELGRQEVSRVAAALARARLDVAVIWHSGKLRAQQTAEILGGLLKPPQGVQQMTGLAPMDDPTIAQRAVEGTPAPCMLVGHLPHLSRLAAHLLVGDPGHEVVRFRMGGVVCLVQEECRWRVRWALTPEIAPH